MKKLKAHKVDWPQIERFLASADKKLALAQKILAFDEEACLQQAYEAMLKARTPVLHAASGATAPGRTVRAFPHNRATRRPYGDADRRDPRSPVETCESAAQHHRSSRNVF